MLGYFVAWMHLSCRPLLAVATATQTGPRCTAPSSEQRHCETALSHCSTQMREAHRKTCSTASIASMLAVWASHLHPPLVINGGYALEACTRRRHWPPSSTPNPVLQPRNTSQSKYTTRTPPSPPVGRDSLCVVLSLHASPSATHSGHANGPPANAQSAMGPPIDRQSRVPACQPALLVSPKMLLSTSRPYAPLLDPDRCSRGPLGAVGCRFTTGAALLSRPETVSTNVRLCLPHLGTKPCTRTGQALVQTSKPSSILVGLAFAPSKRTALNSSADRSWMLEARTRRPGPRPLTVISCRDSCACQSYCFSCASAVTVMHHY